MSFKRDGDDKSALDNQRKRRVADLLSEDIHEEEVTRLSNGKFKCKICSNQPIFDTLNMFYVHKQGKKHLNSMEYAAGQKQELDDLIMKRKHEQMVRDGNITTQTVLKAEIQQDFKDSTLGIKKPRNLYERKAILDLDLSERNTTTTKSCMQTETTSENHLPGNRSNNTFSVSMNVHKSYSGAIKESESAFNSTGYSSGYSKSDNAAADRKSGSSFKLGPKSAMKHDHESYFVSVKNIHKFVGNSSADKNNKYYLSRKKQREETNSQVRNVDGMHFGTPTNQSLVSPAQTWEFYKNYKGSLPCKLKSKEETVKKQPTGAKEHEKNEGKSDNISSGSKFGKEDAEKYLHAVGSGWKKDWTGAWIKDENAEFDSDDEPPDIP